MSKKTLLLGAVQELLNGNIQYHSMGICSNICYITELDDVGFIAMEKFAHTWKNYSGDTGFPISGYLDYVNSPNKWTGEQLELRMSLLEHIKSELLKLTDEEVEEMFGDEL